MNSHEFSPLCCHTKIGLVELYLSSKKKLEADLRLPLLVQGVHALCTFFLTLSLYMTINGWGVDKLRVHYYLATLAL